MIRDGCARTREAEEAEHEDRWLVVGGSAIAAGALALSIVSVAGAGRIDTNNLPGARAGIDMGSTAATAKSTTLKHFTLAASAFGPDGSHTTSSGWFNQWDPSTLSNTTPVRCFDAAADLPAGSTIKSVTFYYTEGSTAFAGNLNRQTLSNHTGVLLAFMNSATSTSPVYTSSTVSVTTTGNVNTADGYSLGACFYGNTTFSGAEVNYTG